MKALLKRLRRLLSQEPKEKGGVLRIDLLAARGDDFDLEVRNQAAAQGKSGAVIIVPFTLTPEEWNHAAAHSKE